MSDQPVYHVPDGQLSLSGPVVRPEGSGLPIRGDLAHIALAEQYLVSSYVIPLARKLARAESLRAGPRSDAETVALLAKDSAFEVLDLGSAWVWGCLGPSGPTGYLPLEALAE
ncbi:hypothetical protein U4960_13850 [Altererythrobacter sp. H2]|uniref:hypothetical protein n=1 Tax=Altererythrobacter sp. H2 TaxID=3108391 RepID=UPI002B4BAE39|nr:hypothetical protein [Altererythrobacter sp. H2]WRK95361.1 hypothetical protein U4960_13850 [Altererythrobacter sp. H2]